MKHRLPVAVTLSLAVLYGGGSVVAGEQAASRTLSVKQKTIKAVGPQKASTPNVGGALAVVAWVDRPDSTYALGETVRMFVRTNKDAYVTVLNVDVNGETTVLFPNRFQKANFVRANQSLEVAGRSQSRVVVTGSVGTELLKAIASTERAPLLDAVALSEAGPFQVVRDGPRRTARSLRVAMNGASGGGATVPVTSSTVAPRMRRPSTEWAMCHTTIETIRTPSSVVQRARSLRIRRTERDAESATCDSDDR